jgi:hypothetical protein
MEDCHNINALFHVLFYRWILYSYAKLSSHFNQLSDVIWLYYVLCCDLYLTVSVG